MKFRQESWHCQNSSGWMSSEFLNQYPFWKFKLINMIFHRSELWFIDGGVVINIILQFFHIISKIVFRLSQYDDKSLGLFKYTYSIW